MKYNDGQTFRWISRRCSGHMIVLLRCSMDIIYSSNSKSKKLFMCNEAPLVDGQYFVAIIDNRSVETRLAFRECAWECMETKSQSASQHFQYNDIIIQNDTENF
jgi:hypothetical protein